MNSDSKRSIDSRKTGYVILAISLLVAGFLIFSGDGKKVNLEEAGLSSLGREEKKGFSLEKDGEKLSATSVEDLSRFLTTQSSKLNLTEKLAESISNKTALDANQVLNGGATVTLPDDQQVASDIAKYLEQEFSLAKDLIKPEELKMSSDNSAEGVFAYFISLRDIMEKYRGKINFDENFAQFSKNNDSTYILPIIQNYDSLIYEIKNLKVPSDFVLSQKNLLDIYIMQKTIFGAVIFYKEDPLRAIVSLSSLEKTEESMENWRLNFLSSLKKHGVSMEIK